MPIARFEMPDGRIGRFEVPDGTTPEQAQMMIQESLPKNQVSDANVITEKKPNQGRLANVALGALKGASDIGATLLYPWDKANDLIRGDREANLSGLITGKQPLSRNEERRQSLKSFFKENADPESVTFKGGEIAADIAGTAGVGGIAAKGLRMIPGVAGAAPKVLSALETGGFKLGAPVATTLKGKALDAGTRALGGAVTGGLSAGLIDPNTAGTGALIGAATPAAVQTAGMVGRGAKNLASGVIRKTLGMTTGVGDEAIGAAFQAGKEGNKAFTDNLRGNVDMTDVLADAKSALNQMRMDRAAQYRAGMSELSKDKTVLDISPIQGAVSSLKSMGSFKGQAINKNAAGVVDEVSQAVDDWAKLNPAEYHTPEGLDALKKKIGDIRSVTQFGTPGRKAADTAYNAVKKQIKDQAPEYSKTMKDYDEASDLIDEIQKSFSLGEKASKDTAMRKLQSLMRNNVNTNYGNRLDLAKQLESSGGKELIPAIAGQAMSSATPRGLQGLAATGSAIYGFSNPAFLASLPFQSPRLVGEAAYKLGQGRGMAGNAIGLLGNRATGLLGGPQNYMPIGTVAPAVMFSQ